MARRVRPPNRGVHAARLLRGCGVNPRRLPLRRGVHPAGLAGLVLLGATLLGAACTPNVVMESTRQTGMPLPAKSPAGADVEAIVLGIVQDGGLPHLGCGRTCCRPADGNPPKKRHVACLGLVDRIEDRRFLIDATPDLVAQVRMMEDVLGSPRAHRRNPVDGILLTHAHVGHYTGLIHLGKEALAADHVAVFGTGRMIAFLRDNEPWRSLIEGGYIEPMVIEPGRAVELSPRLSVTAMLVPHRDELSDTVAYVVRGPGRSLLWLPDVDRWEDWSQSIESVVAGVDLAFLDGTFYDGTELPGRDLSQVRHPLVIDTIARLTNHPPGPPAAGRVFFIHLNHTNPLLQPSDELHDLRRQGFNVAAEGQRCGI